MPKDEEKKVVLPRTASDLQRLKLEKLMKKPDKEVIIADKSQGYNPRAPLEFIRNVWGSSAGAGSGDFHVYRGVRRREYARQKFVLEKAKREEADAEYEKKVEVNVKAADERTAKKRAKRLKKKQKQKGKKPRTEVKEKEEESDEEESEEGEINGEKETPSDKLTSNGHNRTDSS
ncbi:PRKR-interacting protein 1-like [Mizuhopecten yessoensis]|uniref:PRKR-interacting protein 1 n=1 Tax=Mizuhopecten yessoensis TaxID=6573 RepID=A0A210PWV7_MIZYE|nr:PRKR-interacting protein 1-like [Mizuhopecten yessoensis]OWF40971.1 PRKR-interacting protein 1 [Mizuhopecten yessoensis]